MGRIPPRRIGLNFRKRLIRKRLNPPDVTTRVKYDLLTGFHATCPSFNKIQLYWPPRIGGGDLCDLDGWLGRHTPRITTPMQDAHNYESDNRSMLPEGGSVREGAHTPPNVGSSLLLASRFCLFPNGQKCRGPGDWPKTLDSVSKDYTIRPLSHRVLNGRSVVPRCQSHTLRLGLLMPI